MAKRTVALELVFNITGDGIKGLQSLAQQIKLLKEQQINLSVNNAGTTIDDTALRSEIPRIESLLSALKQDASELSSSLKIKEDTLDSLRKTSTYFEQVQNDTAKLANTNTVSDFSEAAKTDVKRLNEEIANLKQQLSSIGDNKETIKVSFITDGSALDEIEVYRQKTSALKKELREKIKLNIESGGSAAGSDIDKLTTDISEYNVAIKEAQQRQKSFEKELQLSDAPKGSLVALRLEYIKLTTQIARLTEQERNSQFGQSLIKNAAKVKSSINSIEQSIGNFTGNVGNYASAFNRVGVAANRFAGFFGVSLGADLFRTQIDEAIQASKEADESQARLQATFRGTKAELDNLSKTFEDLETITGISDEAISDVSSQLLAMGRNVTEVNEILPIAADLAKTYNVSLDVAATALSKSLDGNVKQLRQFVPEVTNLSKESLAAGKALDIVKQRVGGAAEGIFNASKDVNTFKVELGRIQEEAGDFLRKTLPALGSALFTALFETGRRALVGFQQLFLKAQLKIAEGARAIASFFGNTSLVEQYDKAIALGQKKINENLKKENKNTLGIFDIFNKTYESKLKSLSDVSNKSNLEPDTNLEKKLKTKEKTVEQHIKLLQEQANRIKEIQGSITGLSIGQIDDSFFKQVVEEQQKQADLFEKNVQRQKELEAAINARLVNEGKLREGQNTSLATLLAERLELISDADKQELALINKEKETIAAATNDSIETIINARKEQYSKAEKEIRSILDGISITIAEAALTDANIKIDDLTTGFDKQKNAINDFYDEQLLLLERKQAEGEVSEKQYYTKQAALDIEQKTKLLEAQKKHNRDYQNLINERILAERVLIETKEIRDTQSLEDAYSEKLSIIKKEETAIQQTIAALQKKVDTEQLTDTESQVQQASLDKLKQLQREELALTQKLQSDKLDITKKATDAINKVVESGEKNITEAQKTESEKRKEIDKEEIKKKIKNREDYEKIVEQINEAALQVAEAATNALFDIQKQAIEDETAIKNAAIENEYAKKIEAAQGNAELIKALEAEKQAKIAEIEKKAAERRRDIAISEAIIQGALAVIKALPNYILAAAIGITTAIQIATMRATKFEKGGIVEFVSRKTKRSTSAKQGNHVSDISPFSDGSTRIFQAKGKTHAQGGIQLVAADGTRIEVEDDELLMVINARNSRAIQVAQQLNNAEPTRIPFSEFMNYPDNNPNRKPFRHGFEMLEVVRWYNETSTSIRKEVPYMGSMNIQKEKEIIQREIIDKELVAAGITPKATKQMAKEIGAIIGNVVKENMAETIRLHEVWRMRLQRAHDKFKK